MTEVKHQPFCFAGQPAPCKGYFPDDVLPCVCGENAMTELSNLAVSGVVLSALSTAVGDCGATEAPIEPPTRQNPAKRRREELDFKVRFVSAAS